MRALDTCIERECSHKNDDFALFAHLNFSMDERHCYGDFSYSFFFVAVAEKAQKNREIFCFAHKIARDWLTEQSFIWYFMNWIFSGSESK